MNPRTRWLNLGLLLLLIIAIVVAFALIGNPSTPPVVARTAAVTRGTVTSSVTGSGNTESSLSTPVSFQTNGTITTVNVKAGDPVVLGQVLATIDPTTSKASLQTAQAQLDGARAALAEASAGPTDVKRKQDQFSITTAQQGVDNANATVKADQNQLELDRKSTASAIDNAQQSLSNDQRSTATSVKSAQQTLSADTTAQNNAVSTAKASQASACAVTPTTTAATTTATATATATTTTAGSSSNTTTSCTSAKQTTKTAENTRTSTLKADQLAVTSAKQSQQTTLDKDRQAITTAKQNQSDTLLKDNAAITTDKQQVTTAQGQVTTAQLALQADLHPQTPDQIAQSRASLDEAQVTVDNANRTVGQTELRAPQAGVVLAVNGKVGESSGSGTGSSTTGGTTGSSTGTGGTASVASAAASSAGTGFVTIANLSQLAVSANIAEADAAKIQLGQHATVTFPATNATATGTVTQLTPQSTVTNNVVLYPVKVSLDSAPPGVGVGSTANLSITAGESTDALKAPNLAINSAGAEQHTVTVQRGGVDTVVPVTIGLVGDTETEIISGVQAGDLLVLPNTTASTTPTGAGAPRPGG